MRIGRYLARKLASAAGTLYLHLVAIPWLRLRGLLGRPQSIHRAHRAAIVTDGDRAWKIALGARRTIALEAENRARAARTWPQLAPVLPEFEVRDDGFPACLSMRRYRPLAPDDSLPHALSLYALMRTCPAAAPRECGIGDSPDLSSGLAIVARLYGSDAGAVIRALVRSCLERADYHLGFAHGDFHSRNILLDERGAPRLVDLDCVRFNGIQELDALHFAFEREWSNSGRLWTGTLAGWVRGAAPAAQADIPGRFGVKPDPALGAVYLADRLGQEARLFGLEYTRALLDPAIEALCAARQGEAGRQP